ALPRYIVCGRVTKRPIFDFVDSRIHPNDSLTVFPLQDDYSFGILQSNIHWRWFIERCSTLKADWRYTSNTVFDSFPWPQSPSMPAMFRIAKAAVTLRALRAELNQKHGLSLRELYRSIEKPGDHPLKEAHEVLDRAVRDAYGMKSDDDPIKVLFDLNQELAAAAAESKPIVGPGLPTFVNDKSSFISEDRLVP